MCGSRDTRCSITTGAGMQDNPNSCARVAAATPGLQAMVERSSRDWRQLEQARQICESLHAPEPTPVMARPSALGLLALALGGAVLGLVLGGGRRARVAQRAAFDAAIAGQVSWVGRVERYEEAVKAAAPAFMDTIYAAVYRSPSAPAENGIAEPSATLHACCCHGTCETDKETMELRIAAARPIIARMASRSAELLSLLRGSSQ